MAQLKLGAAGVTANEIDISGPVATPPTGIPAGVVGTAKKGPAFVPINVGTRQDFEAKFGTVDSKHFGPMAVLEWLRNAKSVVFLRVLGVGDGKERQDASGLVPGSVTTAGFVVGENQPSGSSGKLDSNPYANLFGDSGRTYFLGGFMSESAGSKFFSEAGLQTVGDNIAAPIVRGVIMAASGVVLRLSSSLTGSSDSSKPTTGQIGSISQPLRGSTIGTVTLTDGTAMKQEFVLLLNGHKGLDANSPNVVTASFDPISNNYFGNVLNTDPYKLQEKGHLLYAHWDIHPSLATITGVGILSASHGADAGGTFYLDKTGVENSAFLLTSSQARNVGTSTVPNFENFEDRFSYAKSPWVISQKFGGKPQNLFRLHALDAGQDISSLYKISIENITPSADLNSKYGSFTIKIRNWEDRDQQQQLIASNETFTVDLNPVSNRYIGKVIGDVHAYYDFDRDDEEQKLVVEGNYPNKSNYVRVEVHPDVENGFVDPSALPMGFRGIAHLVTSGSTIFPSLPNTTGPSAGGVDTAGLNAFRRAVTPPVPMRAKVSDGVVGDPQETQNNKYYWGVQFEHVENVTKPNASILKNTSIKSFAKYFPDFATVDMPFIVGDNAGAADTAANGILDSDRFNRNVFSLENVKVVTGSSGLADVLKWVDATYIRNGNIGVDSAAKTRPFQIKDLAETANKTYAKFTFLLQGGFNGVNIFNEDEATLSNSAVSDDMVFGNGRFLNDGPNVKTYVKAVDIMKNTVNMDIQLLAIPGIRHPIVTDYATVATEDRFDALYVMDIEQFTQDGTESINEVRKQTDITSVYNTLSSFRDRNVDSSFAAAYFPDILYKAPDGNNVFVPPSVLVLGAMALNDAVGHPWFAPAGFTRGAVPRDVAIEARTQLKEEDLDALYNDRINPLVAFQIPSNNTNVSTLVVWGQKTLQIAASALDRVNVRRLLIEIRRQVREIAQTIIFEPNREATLARFSAAVTPRLQRIQALAGLERFRVIIDSSTTTQVDVENNTVRGKIFVQPTKSIEFVSLDFVVANNLQQVQ
jgi:hypothetical protein